MTPVVDGVDVTDVTGVTNRTYTKPLAPQNYTGVVRARTGRLGLALSLRRGRLATVSTDDAGTTSQGQDVTGTLEEVDRLVGRWLPLPDAAELLKLPFPKMRRLVDDRAVVAVRRGSPKVLSVPEAFVVPTLLEPLAGTLSVLKDSGYDDLESLRWLFTPDDSLGGTPVEQLRQGHKTEIRRRAQALAL